MRVAEDDVALSWTNGRFLGDVYSLPSSRSLHVLLCARARSDAVSIAQQ